MTASTLQSRLPAPGSPPLSGDEVLSHFIDFAAEKGLSLYSAQEEGILELISGRHVVLATPTGSGKSLVALAFHFLGLAQGKRSFYTCPIKALVNEKFFALCEALGPQNVGMMTGDAVINRDAPVICCTAEILSNLCLREQRHFADCVVMDEFHYYGDRDRGIAWQVPLLSMPKTQFLLMSATLGDVSAIAQSLVDLTGREVAQVRSTERPVPLDFRYAEDPLHETVSALLREKRAPIYLVNFSQRSAAEQAQALTSIDVCSKEEKEALKAALKGERFDTPFGKDLRRLLGHGIGLHHAGLLPRYRRLVERLAQAGQLKVVSGTDTLGVGVNVPIRTVLFTQLCKFDGQKMGVLSVRDFQQIAGRAGRKGFDDQGSVVAQAPAWVIENKKLMQKRAEGKKVTLQKAPERGYAHFDDKTFERLRTGEPEKLESRFTITHGLIVNLLQSHREAAVSGYRALVELVQKSHTPLHTQAWLLRQARTLTRSLVDGGIVVLQRRTATHRARLDVADGLQHDFSLNHTLSLYLVETLGRLDVDAPDYALELLSVVEAILESPDPVLYGQLDKLKGETVRRLKAEGVEYDQRMEALDQLEWPKPNKEFIYGTFDDFAVRHPWVKHENIRPKSIARDLFEQCLSFNEYIKEYGLGRSEGVLLRYLSDAYKTLLQNVPVTARTEALEDIAAYLLATLKRTDSSLVDEWEAMRLGGPVGGLAGRQAETPRPKLDLATRPKEITSRVRAELHQLVRLLARRAYADLADLLADEAWPEAALEKTLAPFFEQHPAIDTTPRARQPVLTQLVEDGPRRWIVRHALLDGEGEQVGYVEGVVDLVGRTEVDGPLVALRHLGT